MLWVGAFRRDFIFFAAHLYGPGYGRSEATKRSRGKRAVPVRLNKGRATLLLQWPGLAQAPHRSWAEGLAARVEGREMLHEGTGLVRRSHLGRTHNFEVGDSGFKG